MIWRIDVWDRSGAHKAGWPKDYTTADMTGARFRVGLNGLGALIPIEATMLGHPQSLGIQWGEYVQFSVSEAGDWSDTLDLFYGDVRRCPSAASQDEGQWRIVGLHSKRFGYLELDGQLFTPDGMLPVEITTGKNYDLGALARAALENLNAQLGGVIYVYDTANVHLVDSQIGFAAHNNQDVKAFLDKLCEMYNKPPGAPVEQLNKLVWYIGADRKSYFGVPTGGTVELDEADLIPVVGEYIWDDVDAENVVTAVRWKLPYSDTTPSRPWAATSLHPFRQKEALTELVYPDPALPFARALQALPLEEVVKYTFAGTVDPMSVTPYVHTEGHALGYRIKLLGSPVPGSATVHLSRGIQVGSTQYGVSRYVNIKSGDAIWWRTGHDSVPLNTYDTYTNVNVLAAGDDSTPIEAEVETITLDMDKIERLSKLFVAVPEDNAARWKTEGLHASPAHQVTITKIGGGTVTIPIEAVEYVVEAEDYMTTEWLAGQRADPETLAYWALVQEAAQKAQRDTQDVAVRG